ncbi:chromate resistance protein [Rhodoferax lacus]|uniref:Chromate resistance protein n=1 Tax=Rhodoferax lacus TaxID=2184758 RepID=A0A3E1RBD8_9BURK|nr:chromate resistance protein ChrB domain-containing protein [Rhodoferax lacus]RFO96667.1 chromate resistance protein [Rhodoferax lacus]
MKYWLTLIISLPTENANTRMRTWRALKASGAAVLRDGVYLMPEQAACRAVFDGVAAEVSESGGTSCVMRVEEPAGADFKSLFDRSEEFAALLEDIRATSAELNEDNASERVKKARKLRKALAAVVEIDFFGSEAQKQTEAALQALELALARILSPDEPHAVAADIARLDIKAFKGKTWATRQRPWVDRLACAWLIRTFIDRKAKFMWLENSRKCPRDAVGFDFDGATFSHIGAKVTFEVMLTSFGLDTPALQRIGHLVHFLDAGGLQPPEASGIENVLAGMRDSIASDDRLLQAACAVFDGLFQNFSKQGTSHDKP